jgi:hypothetical protein
MHHKKYNGIVGLVAVVALGGYFGAYFLAADYMDVGSNNPMYLLRYRIGSVSLHRLSSFFEPARRLDELCLRRRQTLVVDYGTP